MLLASGTATNRWMERQSRNSNCCIRSTSVEFCLGWLRKRPGVALGSVGSGCWGDEPLLGMFHTCRRREDAAYSKPGVTPG